MKKNFLILKATNDICGNEIGLIEHHCKLLDMEVFSEDVINNDSIIDLVRKYSKDEVKFNYIYLCTHGDKNSFQTNLSGDKIDFSWSSFGGLICETEILKNDTILLLGCCKGGMFNVATDIMAVCNKINFVCGVKWNVKAWDLTTGFIVFLHNIENKNAEPSYAAQKASLATDYTFVCYDRDEIEMMPQFLQRQLNLYIELGWADDHGNWISTDPKVNENTGHTEVL